MFRLRMLSNKWLGIQYCGQSNQPQQDKSELPSGFKIELLD